MKFLFVLHWLSRVAWPHVAAMKAGRSSLWLVSVCLAEVWSVIAKGKGGERIENGNLFHRCLSPSCHLILSKALLERRQNIYPSVV